MRKDKQKDKSNLTSHLIYGGIALGTAFLAWFIALLMNV